MTRIRSRGIGHSSATDAALGLLCFALCVAPAGGAGNAKLWELGEDVEQNPRTVFVLFTFTVLLTMVIECLKHRAEHATHGTHRGQALNAIFSELMMIGVVSFLLIVAAEVGLTDIKIKKSGAPDWCFPDGSLPPVNGSGSGGSGGSGSAASSKECYFMFDLLMFEYAHLVLFFMGIFYGIFIQVCFMMRNRYVRNIHAAERATMTQVCTPHFKPPSLLSLIGLTSGNGWTRTMLFMRGAIVIHHMETLQKLCDPAELKLETALAVMRNDKEGPHRRPSQDDCLSQFDMSKFAHIAVAEVLVHLLHVPTVVWLAIIFMSAINLVHQFGTSLSVAVVFFALIGPVFAVVLLFRMASQLRQVMLRAVGHPKIASYNHSMPDGGEAFNVSRAHLEDGMKWAENPEENPWACLTGCIDDDHPLNFLDMNDPKALEVQIQVVVFSTCFLVGQVVMLGNLIVEEMGPAPLILLYAVACVTLFFLIPRAILMYTLIHQTESPPRQWLKEGVQYPERVTLDMPVDAALSELETYLSSRSSAVVSPTASASKSLVLNESTVYLQEDTWVVGQTQQLSLSPSTTAATPAQPGLLDAPPSGPPVIPTRTPTTPLRKAASTLAPRSENFPSPTSRGIHNGSVSGQDMRMSLRLPSGGGGGGGGGSSVNSRGSPVNPIVPPRIRLRESSTNRLDRGDSVHRRMQRVSASEKDCREVYDMIDECLNKSLSVAGGGGGGASEMGRSQRSKGHGQQQHTESGAHDEEASLLDSHEISVASSPMKGRGQGGSRKGLGQSLSKVDRASEPLSFDQQLAAAAASDPAASQKHKRYRA